MKEIIITKIDHGKAFGVTLGSSIVIKLPENPSTGFRWKVIETNNEILRLIDSNFSLASDSGVGGGGTRTFILRTLKEGPTKFGLKLLQEWEPQSFVDSFEIMIHVKKT